MMQELKNHKILLNCFFFIFIFYCFLRFFEEVDLDKKGFITYWDVYFKFLFSLYYFIIKI